MKQAMPVGKQPPGSRIYLPTVKTAFGALPDPPL
jgi:hypothetical protein